MHSLSSGNSTTSAPRVLTVNIDVVAPAVSISAPSTDTTYTTPQTVILTATATDAVGVTRVDFYDGATLRTSDTTSPFKDLLTN